MTTTDVKVHQQNSPYDSPWSFSERMGVLLWHMCWTLFCSWTPKPLNAWRLLWLRLFGCKISGKPFVHQRARIQIPWNLSLGDRACLGDRANAYSLGLIEIKNAATVAQEAYLCTGTHDFSKPSLPLVTAKIIIEEEAFIGARAFIMPGIKVGKRSVVGACSVVTKDLPENMICVGQPCQPIKRRPVNDS